MSQFQTSVLNKARTLDAIITHAPEDPGKRNDIKYSAQTVGGDFVFVHDQIPINPIISPDTTLPVEMQPNIVPCKVNDPCLILRYGNEFRLYVFTEVPEYGECQ